MSLSKTLSLILIACFFHFESAYAVELCEPIKQLKRQDEIGGMPSKRLDDYIAALEKSSVEGGWLSLEDYGNIENKSSCSRIAIVPTSTRFIYPNIFGHKPSDFLKALSVEKKNIIEFYKSDQAGDQKIEITDQEYNRLAFLAAGVMGAESGGGKSGWFILEHIATSNRILEQLTVCGNRRTWKACTTAPLTSRGMTQIKTVPYIGKLYEINRKNLRTNTYLAGVATVGFLIQEYKRFLKLISNKKRYYLAPVPDSKDRAKAEIRKDQFEIFLTYIYRGDIREIYNSTATPDQSCYLRRVLKHQEYLRFYVLPDQDCSKAGESILEKEKM